MKRSCLYLFVAGCALQGDARTSVEQNALGVSTLETSRSAGVFAGGASAGYWDYPI